MADVTTAATSPVVTALAELAKKLEDNKSEIDKLEAQREKMLDAVRAAHDQAKKILENEEKISK